MEQETNVFFPLVILDSLAAADTTQLCVAAVLVATAIYFRLYVWRMLCTRGTFFQRLRWAQEEHQRDKLAVKQTFGSMTLMIKTMHYFLLMSFAFVMTIDYVRHVAILYVVAGLGFTFQTARSTRRPNWRRLSLLDKLNYHLFFAWFWPLGDRLPLRLIRRN